MLYKKNIELGNLNIYNHNDIQISGNNIISNLVSELFNHINSKESFNHISDLLIASLTEYKKKFQNELQQNNIENSSVSFDRDKYNNTEFCFNESRNEYLSISNDIHSILSNCQDLTNTQKLDFCKNQRYFMKLYLKEIVKKILTA